MEQIADATGAGCGEIFVVKGTRKHRNRQATGADRHRRASLARSDCVAGYSELVYARIGNLYVCANPDGNATLYQVPINSNSFLSVSQQ